MYVNLLCSNHSLAMAPLLFPKIYIMYYIPTWRRGADSMVPTVWQCNKISIFSLHRCMWHKKKQWCDTVQYENNAVIRDITPIAPLHQPSAERELLYGGLRAVLISLSSTGTCQVWLRTRNGNFRNAKKKRLYRRHYRAAHPLCRSLVLHHIT